MPGINTYTLAILAFTGLVQACDYGRYLNKPADDFDYRRCTVGCDKGDMVLGHPNYDCCRPVAKGSSLAATCTAIAASASAAGVTTCTYTSLATTDSTGMAAPTGYTPAYRTAAPMTSPAVTSDTAGQSYESLSPDDDVGLDRSSIFASAVTTWVSETASPDCPTSTLTDTSVYTTPAPESTYSAPPETSAAPPTNTCACPDPHASDAPPPAETSDTHGEAYSSDAAATASAVPYGSKPEAGDDLSGLDRRLVQRTEIQYTCECPPAGAETSDYAGHSWSETSSIPSSTDTAYSAEPTEDCEEEKQNAAPLGSKPEGEVQDNEPAKRFLPLDFPIGHPVQNRAYGPPPATFVPDDEDHWKRTEPTESITDNYSEIPGTVTSTTTVTGTCSAVSEAYPSVSASITTSAVPEVTGGGGYASAVSSNIDDFTSAIPSEIPAYTSDTAGEAYSSDLPSEAAPYGSSPTGEVVDNARKRKMNWV